MSHAVATGASHDRALAAPLALEPNPNSPIVSKVRRRAPVPASVLTPWQALSAVLIFIAWLVLFASGILINTRPYRMAISPSGVAALEHPSSNDDADSGALTSPGQPARISESAAWLVVLTCFLPINLAWVCAAASLLGGYGNRANLADDEATRRFHDNTNPFVSALLRGFFVYLFMVSGLLLLDDAPFSNPAPGQYIRLAGFLSLFSFVVSYQPRLFSVLIVWAFHRIQVREGEEETAKTGLSFHQRRTTSEEVSVTGAKVVNRDASSRTDGVQPAASDRES